MTAIKTLRIRLLSLVSILFSALAQPGFADDYHVDSANGNDTTGDGSLVTPWKSLARLGTVTLAADDRVLLKRGSVFRERLEVSDSGAPGNPIVIDGYDSGPAPVISAGHFLPQGAAWSGPDVNGEFSLAVGPTSEFYTSIAVLVRGQPAGIDSYLLLGKGTAGTLAEDTYALTNVAGQRTILYRPPSGTHPAGFEFELSRRNYAISVTGDWVTLRNLEALLGNVGHPTLDAPITDATFVSYGSHTVIENCRAAFSRSYGIAIAGPQSMIDGSLGEHNHSTGLYVLGSAATGCTIQHSVSRYNGNLEFADLDRGGIGVQGDDAVIQHNVVHDNGNLADTTGPRIAGDDAISLFDNNSAIVVDNFVYNSARGAIRMSYTANSFGHQIIGNVISNWNLAAQSGTLSTQAIAMVAFGDTANSGNHRIWNNTIFSNQVATTLIGIQLALPSNNDVMRDTSVLNNVVYLPDTTAVDSFGLRLTRESLFESVDIDYNDVQLPQSGNNYSAFAGVFSTAADLVSALGYESHGLNEDPFFAAVPVDPENPLSFDLAPISPLIDAATNVGLVSDFIGRSIPSGLAPDLGAFERPFGCADADGDGVCDEDDLCPGGPLVIEGLLPPMGPLTPDQEPVIFPEKAFKQNRTLPLKLRLLCGEVTLTDGDVEPPAIASVLRIGDSGDFSEVDLDAGESNDNGLLFRFSDPSWIYNLNTKNLEPGSYVITIVTPEGLPYRAAFVLK